MFLQLYSECLGFHMYIQMLWTSLLNLVEMLRDLLRYYYINFVRVGLGKVSSCFAKLKDQVDNHLFLCWQCCYFPIFSLSLYPLSSLSILLLSFSTFGIYEGEAASLCYRCGRPPPTKHSSTDMSRVNWFTFQHETLLLKCHSFKPWSRLKFPNSHLTETSEQPFCRLASRQCFVWNWSINTPGAYPVCCLSRQTNRRWTASEFCTRARTSSWSTRNRTCTW